MKMLSTSASDSGDRSLVRLSGSTIVLFIAILAMTSGSLWPRSVPLQIRVWFTYALWPLLSAVSVTWSLWNVVKSESWRRLQFALELIAGMTLLILYYMAVTSPP